MKVELFKIISEAQQRVFVVSKMRDEWTAKSPSNFYTAFKQPSDEEINLRRDEFPLETLIGKGELLTYGIIGDGGDFGTSGVVLLESGAFVEYPIEFIKIAGE